MAPLFPPWSNTALRVAIGAVPVGAFALIAALMIYVRTPSHNDQLDEVDQPVQFDHRHHVQDDGVECKYCHNTVDRAATAGIPSTELCMGCHSQIWSESPMLEPVRRSYFSGMPIPWNRVTNVPDFVYFNHSAHVTKGVACVTCHGRVDQMATVYKAEPMTMSWCLGCHRAPERNLRPPALVTDMRWDPGPEREAIGIAVARSLGVRSLTHCTTCHR